MIVVSDYEMHLGAQLFALKRAIGALIVTHPNPEAFARAFDAATGLAQIEHALAPGATPEIRETARRTAAELLGLAQDEVSRRQQQTKGEG